MTDNSLSRSDVTPIESIPWDSSWPKLSKNEEREWLFGYLDARFGIPLHLFDHYLLYRRKKAWFLMRKSPQLADGAHLKITKVGLRAFQRVGAFIKPTTRFIQIFGRQATRGTYRLSRDQLQTLIAGEEIPVDLEMDKGYVILTLGRDDALGLGFFINHAIRSQLPKGELRPEMMI